MAKQKKTARNEFIGPTMGLVGGAVTLGVGGSIVGAIPGTTAATAGGGLTAAASFMSPIGATIGGGLVVGQLRKTNKQVKPRK